MIGSSSWVFVVRARPARPAPIASEPVSPMKICAGAAFHQRNPAHGAEHRRGDHREVERVLDLVAGVAERPEADDHVGDEGEDRRAGGEAVEAVGEVHGVRDREDHQHAPERPPDRVQVEVEEVEAGERELGVDLGEGHAEHDEADGDDEQAERLGPLGEPEVALLARP